MIIPEFKAYLMQQEMLVGVYEINFKKEEIVWQIGLSREVAKFEDIELLQTTGLTDYHYREYVEGDIARDVTSEETGVVEYVEGAFVMRFAGGDSVDLRDVKDEFEIIGNKFEHPHILGED